MFPNPDPIPLPAPVWLIKLLSLLTLGLHFSAVMILVGSLAMVIWLDIRGRAARNVAQVSAAFTLARRLPVIMTYVINLGVPPLLFLQVLYGQQIYSSSVLMAVPWISIIGLLMLAYWLLYRTVALMERGRPIALIAGPSLLLVLGVGHLYSMNMTLMLRPELWQDMYAANPRGLQGFSDDPTVMSRWLFVMFGGPLLGGLWAVLLSHMAYLNDEVRPVLRTMGGRLALIGALAMLFFGRQVMVGQPAVVQDGITASSFYNISLVAAVGALLLAGVVGVVQSLGKASVLVSTLGLVLGFVGVSAAGIVRDGIRDLTLKQHGFDVFATPVYANWSVLIAFLLLFVIMLVIIFWLLMVMRRATPPTENVTL